MTPPPGSTPRRPRPPLPAGGCSRPILLRGRVDHIDGSTGELIHRYTTSSQPGGVLPVPCKTRRASRCLPCAQTYRYDTYQLIRAGLTGGKGIPETVATHPAVFATLTAPSFGPVHARRDRHGRVLPCRPRRKAANCPHGRPAACPDTHPRDDPRLGQPICPDCYDYDTSVLFNALAPELWRRFTITLRRTLARHAGLTVKEFSDRARVSFAKVAEYQRRGTVHFHAIIRLDGPHGPATTPPAWASAALLADAIGQAATAVAVTTPAADGQPARVLAWGGQVDVRPVTTAGDLTDGKVAAYVAKYATKAAECTGTLDRRITPADQLGNLPVTSHARRLIAACLRLGRQPELEHLRLTAWAHMLGFRGHFSTKSRTYSTTLGALREARATHQRAYATALGLIPATDPETTLVIGDWHYAGRGSPPVDPAALRAGPRAEGSRPPNPEGTAPL
jgi:hypothetical protein